MTKSKKALYHFGAICGLVARVLKYAPGYEIRYVRNGYRRVVFHKNLAEAKRMFCGEATA